MCIFNKKRGRKVKILVDADACPVKKIIVKIAIEFKLDVIMFIDTSHVYEDGYSTVITVDQARDSVDLALINKTEKGDIVVTQDYGVATMALSKKAYSINQNGLIFDNDNIDNLLYSRYLNAKHMKSGGRVKGPQKRKKEDDEKFEIALRKLYNIALG